MVLSFNRFWRLNNITRKIALRVFLVLDVCSKDIPYWHSIPTICPIPQQCNQGEKML